MKASDVRVLIVEDEAIAAMLVKAFLGRLGFASFLQATTAEEAIAVASRENPGLIVMDIGLPGALDGIDAARAIKSRGETAVLFATAYADEETRKRAAETRPIGFLSKPVKLASFEAVLREAGFLGT